MFGFGDMGNGVVQITHGLLHGRLMLDVEGEQLVENVTAFTQARMAFDL